MKNCFLNVILALATAAALSTHAALPAKTATTTGQNKTAPEETPVPKSTFGIPAKPQDGHDPFFPASDRLYALKPAPKQASSATGSALVFNGMAGTQDHRLAMINSKTFAEGEEAMVNISGGRVRVRCLEIKGDVVVVEVAGERRELHFQDR
jgi:hypothetical protein